MVAFVVSILISAALVGLVFWYGKRRQPGTPLTWGEAIAAATYVFFLLYLLYGVVPHQWLTWADSELNWRPDVIWLGPGGSMTILGATITWETFPVQISAQAVRDVVAVLIYVVGLGGQMWMWSWWQKRGTVVEAPAPESTYGRPLVRKG